MQANTASGCVAIGRNEGDRLVACLQSALRDYSPVIYVDSGSTDGSVEAARSLGCECVSLDMSVAFTAARARNAGLEKLLSLWPDARFVQFVDGDCEIAQGWCEAALNRIEGDERCAVVCGRRRERFPERSIFNRLCDIEWDTPIGTADACGGDSLMRIEALKAVGGFDGSLIAGEEPELCLRLRRQGWTIERINAEMTLHDAAMTRFTQWWRRTRRAGFAYALGAAKHGASPDRHWCRETVRILFWGIVLPAVAMIVAAITSWVVLLAIPAAFAWSAARTFRDTRSRGSGRSSSDAALYAASIACGRVPEAVGVLEYAWMRIRGQARGIIEYK